MVGGDRFHLLGPQCQAGRSKCWSVHTLPLPSRLKLDRALFDYNFMRLGNAGAGIAWIPGSTFLSRLCLPTAIDES